jgi:hypothetical protein
VYKWRIYCETDSQWEYKFTDNETPITVCPSNSGHTVNPNSVSIIDTVSSSRVQIKEEEISTGGRFRVHGYTITAAPNTVTSTEVSWDYPVSVLAVYFKPGEVHRGDVLNVHVGPSTAVGTVSANAVIGDTTFTIDTPVLDQFVEGLTLHVTDGVSTSYLGDIIEVSGNVITTKYPVTYDITAGTSGVKISSNMMRDFEIGYTGDYTFGLSKLSSSYVPIGFSAVASYQNNSNVEKRFAYYVEYLY